MYNGLLDILYITIIMTKYIFIVYTPTPKCLHTQLSIDTQILLPCSAKKPCTKDKHTRACLDKVTAREIQSESMEFLMGCNGIGFHGDEERLLLI